VAPTLARIVANQGSVTRAGDPIVELYGNQPLWLASCRHSGVGSTPPGINQPELCGGAYAVERAGGGHLARDSLDRSGADTAFLGDCEHAFASWALNEHFAARQHAGDGRIGGVQTARQMRKELQVIIMSGRRAMGEVSHLYESRSSWATLYERWRSTHSRR
jgi:hypothetical protein